ncbi:dihydrofolate reductase family protein [Falsiroseomonas oryzae]|uniref:dihydrofolate reductase family protein n=1 Tax=Falsiroseomonas oryzae TaxID=2766473 RepID=UPI0022EA4BEF|nr:dihydrofolate reductase family protein [Roseomonas sp. MO-31]
MRTIWHCYIAVSLDGRIARPDGSVDWLGEEGPPEEFGYDAFYAGVDAIVMGRATYDAVRAMGDWPYPGKPTVVVTRRPLPDAPAGVSARGGDLAALAAELEVAGCRRVWVEGGGDVIRQMLAIGKLDILEMAVMPRVLGAGIPLFPDGTPDTRWRLVSCTPRAGGALHAIYERAA